MAMERRLHNARFKLAQSDIECALLESYRVAVRVGEVLVCISAGCMLIEHKHAGYFCVLCAACTLGTVQSGIDSLRSNPMATDA